MQGCFQLMNTQYIQQKDKRINGNVSNSRAMVTSGEKWRTNEGYKEGFNFYLQHFFFLNRSQQDMAECFFVKSRQKQ